ncbi:MAG: DNA polymerase III subunit chi [Hyphomicrobiaceae bacterium]|nr:DNA polymerase III subunit chi [Hyphomicrobiaceae bacterium]MCC0024693.1 DNA polymerase III subunit chi [Hyphomicrobiaceae bacterium]
MSAKTDILFYHLENQPLERVLPVLLEKTLERGWRAVVECGSVERAENLDAVLWTLRDDGFLPHGLSGSSTDARQPVLLTVEGGNANGAQVRFFVDRARPSNEQEYERVVYMFDGHDVEAINAAREDWKRLRDDFEVTYWQQSPEGRWQKKG